MLTGFRFGHDPRRNPSDRWIRGTFGSDVRHKNVVARVALIALLATVTVPGPAISRGPSPASTVDPNLFERVEVAALARGTAVTIQPQDPGARSAGNLDESSILIEPSQRTGPMPAPVRPAQKAATPRTISRET